LKVIKHDPLLPLDYDQSTLDHLTKSSIVVTLHRTRDTIRDACDKIGTALGYPPSTQFVVLLRHEPFVSAKTGSATGVRCEVYNLSWRMSKLVEEGPKLESFASGGESLTTGILYVEEGDTKDKSENFKWH
jgi:hypothetical protein